ncbi:MAG: hypothetical protein HOJ35_05805 [Bdellovibrionales bacterium]|jgi:tetratricopeptide (TPR) repeat protein|nr:hypothetical protein [Bdellovibrionales bacterium]
MIKLIFICSLLFSSVVFSFDNSVLLFEQSQQDYHNGKYSESITKLEKLLTQSEGSGEVLFNLANSYMQDGQLGNAIFNYYKANELMPRDGDINYNLKFAQNKIVDKVTDNTPIISKIFPFSLFELSLILSVLIILFVIFNIIVLFSKNDWIRWGRNLALSLIILFVFPLTYHYFFKESFGVVVAENANVYSGTGRNNVKLFTLHEGTKFSIQSSNQYNGWIRISIDQNKKGWVNSNQVVY